MKIFTVGSKINDDKGNEYTLMDAIGEGGFGIVYKAVRQSDNMLFAVKTLPTSFTDKAAVESFFNEMELASTVKSDNVITYEYISKLNSDNNSPPFIIMEFANGGTLMNFIERQTEFLTNEALIDIYFQIINGIEAINNLLVHRDIKPANILLSNGIPKIADFGLAKVANDATRTKTFKGWGSRLYMAPEAFDYTKNTIQMDIYSMGIVFYQLATLEYPYAPKPISEEDAKNAHLIKAITPPTVYNRNLSEIIVSVLNRMMSKKTSERFANWKDVKKALMALNSEKSHISSFVNIALQKKNAVDDKIQKSAETAKKMQQEKDEFCGRVFAQFERDVLRIIKNFAEEYNESQSEHFRLSNFSIPRSFHDRYPKLSCKLTSPIDENSVFFEIEAVIKNNYKRQVPSNDLFRNETNFKEEVFTHVYKTKTGKSVNIMLFAKASGSFGGFNVILLDNGTLYGDWVIKEFNWLSESRHPQVPKYPFAVSISEINDQPLLASINDVKSSYEYAFNEDSILSKTLSILGM